MAEFKEPRQQVTIISDGTGKGTSVFIGGRRVHYVISVQFSFQNYDLPGGLIFTTEADVRSRAENTIKVSSEPSELAAEFNSRRNGLADG